MKVHPFYIYLFRFFLTFCILFYGTIAWIGICAPGGYYWSFAAGHFNYISWLRYCLLHSAGIFLSVTGFDVYIKDIYTLSLHQGRGVHVGFDCLGYGVMSFWSAFILANEGNFIKKIKWLLGGLLLIWFINVLRISLLLVAVNKQWPMPLGLDHHTWFTIVAYFCIFTMIYFFDRSHRHRL